ncbi:MAG: hypothetical protein L3V56_11700, partial [Candidatus Magnetoovum sp. WYHC-5]|nr:hypothetical protein [Candidatus Magnetoovum sp. WYHC-5]
MPISTTFVLNTQTNALSEYTKYPFNSFFKIDNNYYGVSSTGIYELNGDDDNGQPINASIKTARLDFGQQEIKNIADIYLMIKACGSYTIKTISHDNRTHEYPVLDEDLQIHTKHIKLSKGVRGCHWE